MRTELRLAPHLVTSDATVVEIYHDGRFIGTIVGFPEGSGVRVITKHGVDVQTSGNGLNVVEVGIIRKQQ